jgi:hypothetical protein
MRSLLPPDRVAPLVVIGTIVIANLEGLVRGWDFTAGFAFFVGIPAIGVVVVATLLARLRFSAAAIASSVTFAAHAAYALMLFRGKYELIAIVVAVALTVAMFAAAMPFLVACVAVEGRREYGDKLLAIGAGWSAMLQIAIAVAGWVDARAAVAGIVFTIAIAVYAIIRMRRSP